MQALPLLLALASLPTVPNLPQAAALSQEQPEGDARELNRILYLRGGGSVRAKARFADGRWEYRVGGQWAQLPVGSVERVALEREVLAQARELERKVNKDQPAARVPYADWLLRAGLLEEAIGELDHVLSVDPDQPQALALLAAPPTPIRAPGAEAEDLETAIRSASTAPRALQELSLAAFARRPDAQELPAELRRALVSHSPRIRTFAALGLRRTDPLVEVKGLLSRAVLDGSAQVRREAALALRDTQQEAVVLPVLRAMGSSTPAVRENAIEALGNMGFGAALDPLMLRLAALSSPQGGGGAWRAPASHIFVGRQIAYVQDFDVEVAQFASVADPQVNTLVEGSVLDVRVIGTSEVSFAVESRKIRGSLRKLTGENPGDTNRSWLDWWEQNKHRFGVNTPKRPPETGSGSSPR